MNDIDRKIQAALQRDETDNHLSGEPNLAEEVITAFRGRRRWLSALAVAFSLIAFAGTVWAGLRFFAAETVTAQVQWGALAFVFLLMVSMLKLWFWLEINTNRVLRELKRVELLLIQRP